MTSPFAHGNWGSCGRAGADFDGVVWFGIVMPPLNPLARARHIRELLAAT